MNILIVDGQGGGIGKTLVARLSPLAEECGFEITAVGTNSIASLAMKKAGAKYSATGENAVAVNAANADIIAGSIGIIAGNSMMGELSPKMAQAISQSRAVKILIPFNRCNLRIMGVGEGSMSAMIDEAVNEMLSLIKDNKKDGL